MRIIKSLSDKGSVVTLLMPNYRMSGMTLEEAKKIQDGYDAVIDQVAADIEASDLDYKELHVAYEGRAFFNYDFYYGKDHAMKEAPEEYEIYKEENAVSESGNCLLVSEDLHPTQLGSYLQAAAIYSAVYGESAEDTVSAYHAEVTDSVYVIAKDSPGMNFAIKNGAFDNEKLLKEACFIADQTENAGMDLKTGNKTND